MLDYVIDLLDNAIDFSWSSTKASHAVLLCRMVKGKIKSLLETEKIDRIRRAHAQRHSVSFKVALKELKTNIPLQQLPLVCIITRVSVHKSRPMRPKGYCISMYVLHVGLNMASHTLIHRLNVVKIQKKTISPGQIRIIQRKNCFPYLVGLSHR